MTCKTNEAVALNRFKTSELVKRNGVIALKADKSQGAPHVHEVDRLLEELGNSGKAIPFYAIYPGDGGKPILFDGLISQQQVLDALEKAGPSKMTGEGTTTAQRSAGARR